MKMLCLLFSLAYLTLHVCGNEQYFEAQNEGLCASRENPVIANLSNVYFDKSQTTRLGLRTGYTWSSLFDDLTAYNEDASSILHRVVLVGRHGEGVHNVAEAKYGSQSWDETWSKLNGDDQLTWGPDANLTGRGTKQAMDLRGIWQSELMAGLTIPELRYSSPLSRAIETARITFDLQGANQTLTILEDLRETTGVHTCDRRSDKRVLDQRFSPLVFEQDFQEHDRAWSASQRETDQHTRVRARRVVNHIMAKECLRRRDIPGAQSDNRVISITSHSGFLRNLFTELHLGQLDMPTAGMTGLILSTNCQDFKSTYKHAAK